MTPNVETLREMARSCDFAHSRLPISRRNRLNGFSARISLACCALATILVAVIAPSAIASPPGRALSSSRTTRPNRVFKSQRVIPAALTISAAPVPNEIAPMPIPLFPRVRALSIEEARGLALKRSANLSLSAFKIAAARAQEREVSRRIKVGTTGGLDPFSGQIRFYLALDLERLAGLNKAEKDGARQKVEQERIGERSAKEDAIKRVSAAWYSLTASQMALDSAARRRQSSRALYVAADARFRAGAGELSGALGTMNAAAEADDAYQSARQKIALDCLELAQSCGFLTAEEMENALGSPLAALPPAPR